jgi:hypothetical protein
MAERLAHLYITAMQQRRPKLSAGPSDRDQVPFQELEEEEGHVLELPVRSVELPCTASFSSEEPHANVLQRVQFVRPVLGRAASPMSTGWSSSSTFSSVASVCVSSPSVSGATTHLVAGSRRYRCHCPFIPPPWDGKALDPAGLCTPNEHGPAEAGRTLAGWHRAMRCSTAR